jgi:hypothetical protein
MNCRHCRTSLDHIFIDLGYAPISNAYLTAEDLVRPEKYYPLKIMVCDQCWLVQTVDYAQANQLFGCDYAYLSSTSSDWLAHAARYAQAMISKLSLTPQSFVIEVASNDGYLLKNFIAGGIPCLGIEPTDSTATAAEQLGIPVLREFFGEALGEQLAAQGKQADLVVGNNVYAHVPNINDFTKGLKTVLKRGGTITLEFPHLMRLIEQTQFDTIYHEHFSYLSLYTVKRLFEAADMRVIDVLELPTHGGSLRIYGCHADDTRIATQAVDALLKIERKRGLQSISTYQGFEARASRVKDDLLLFLINQTRSGKKIAAYGAAAKGNTLLNYAGIKADLLSFICDAAPSKQNKFMPGSHIPILNPKAIQEKRPDFLLILPWNIADEITKANVFIREWGGKFVTAIPELRVF